MRNSGHEACLLSLECAIEIAKNCAIPTLTWDEFSDLAKIIWDENYEELSKPQNNFFLSPEELEI